MGLTFRILFCFMGFTFWFPHFLKLRFIDAWEFTAVVCACSIGVLQHMVLRGPHRYKSYREWGGVLNIVGSLLEVLRFRLSFISN